ncbi:MAG: cyclin-dependent kinase inhibitor 3 family protein [Halioglobus sp.]
MRTSQDYPLQIDFVSSPAAKGRIGMTFCPGKKQQGAMTGDWDRDLALDLGAICASGASVLINLMEDHEMVELGVADTAEHVPPGIDYLRMPIPDVGTPHAEWEHQWSELGSGLLERLRNGEDVVLHCKGGLGRTGMIAACLLVEFGSTSEDAISAVRESRSGRIETVAQEQYVRAFGSR